MNNDGSLFVKGFRPSNAVGVYICIAENHIGKAQKSLFITTKSKNFESPTSSQHIPFFEKTNENESLGNAESSFSKSLRHHFEVSNYDSYVVAPPLLHSLQQSVPTNDSFCTENLSCSLNGESHTFVMISNSPCLFANQKETKSRSGIFTIARSFNSSLNSKTSSFKRNELIICYSYFIFVKIFKDFFNV